MAEVKHEFRIPKLENDNYAAWKWQFVNVANSYGLGALFGEGEVSAALDSKGLSLIGSCLSNENILKIVDCRTFKKAWLTLELCYENKTTYEPQALYRRLNTYRIHSAAEVSKGVSELRGIAAQLKNLNEQVSENCLIGAILSSLPESFKTFISIWKNAPTGDADHLIAKLMAEANEQTSEAQASSALIAKNSQRNKSKDQCRYCKKFGHWLKDCPTRPSRKESIKHQQYQQKNSQKNKYDPNGNRHAERDIKETSTKSEDKTLAFTTSVSNSVYGRDYWVADSGCTTHMSPHRDLFMDIQPSTEESIFTADRDGKLEVCGKGSIETKQGLLTDVLYVPKLGYNLFSLSAAANKGLTHRGDASKIVFYHGNQELFVAKATDGLFLIHFEPIKGESLVLGATIEDWHARFAHMGKGAIKYMHKHNLVKDLNFVSKKDEKCPGCQLNKCTRTTHPLRTGERAHLPGQVLHVDTAGPCNVASLSGAIYLILCKDEASNYRQIAFVKDKGQIGDKVKEFVSQANLDTGNQVLKLCTDNGSEYVNNSLSVWLKERGIIHERSVPYVPEQNGFIERDIRTVKEAARTILNNSGLEKQLWAEACNTSVYVLNRSVASTNCSATPYEAWFGQKPSVKNLRVFGQVAVLKKPDREIKGTWDTKGVEVIFVGYTNRFNNYRFYHKGAVRIGCDAIFLNKLYNGTQTDDPLTISNEDFTVICEGETLASSQVPLIGSASSTAQPTTSNSQDQEQPVLVTRNDDEEDTFEDVDQSPVLSQERAIEPIVVDVRHIQTGARGVTVMTPSEVESMIATSPHQMVTLLEPTGQSTFQLNRLRHNANTGRWQNTLTGKFISRMHLKAIKDNISQRPGGNLATALITVSEVPIPNTFAEAMEGNFRDEWKQATDEEMSSLIENQVFDIIDQSEAAKKPIGSRWVFTVKSKPTGQIEKFKARVVAKGFSQKYGIDFLETYSSVVQIMSTRLMLSYAAQHRLIIKQFDIKTAFLYASLDEEILMEPPEGVKQDGKLWRLKRSLYGLRQSPRMWNQKFSDALSKFGLKISQHDQSIFYLHDPLLIVIVYVDDGLIFGKNETNINQVLDYLQEEFKMRTLSVNIYRGLEIELSDDGIFLHQASYVRKILATFGMDQSRPAENPLLQISPDDSQELDPEKPYRNVIGSLAYLADTSRPDISFAVNHLARFLSSPTRYAWLQANQILRYLKGTEDLGILLKYGKSSSTLTSFGDSDFAGDKSTSKSTTGFVMLHNGAIFHWKTQLQRHVTLSSTEAEVVALCSLSKELSWIRRMMIELNIIDNTPATLFCDNTSAITVALSEKATQRTRHLRAQNAYVREQVVNKELVIDHVRSCDQLADMLTKNLPTSKFLVNRNKLMRTRTLSAGKTSIVQNLIKQALLIMTLLLFVNGQLGQHAQLQEIVLQIKSPCDLLKDPNIADKEFGPTDNLLIYRRDAHRAYIVKQCQLRFNTEIDHLFLSLQKCDRHREKRSLKSILKTTAKIAAGVTNFIISESEQNPKDTNNALTHLGSMVQSLTSKFFEQHDQHKEVEIQDELAVSPTGEKHLDIIEHLDGKLSLDLLFASYHTMREVITGLSNLWAIDRSCREGKLATDELGELLGNPAISEINSDSTHLVEIEANRESHTIKFIFTISEPEPMIDGKMLAMIILIIVVSLTCTMIGSITAYYIIQKQVKKDTRQVDVENLKSSPDDEDIYKELTKTTKG